jgi:hypothetical protein
MENEVDVGAEETVDFGCEWGIMQGCNSLRKEQKSSQGKEYQDRTKETPPHFSFKLRARESCAHH